MTQPADRPPQTTHRLFPELDEDAGLTPDDFVIGRLLEDGDRTDLRWLCSAAGRDRLGAWMARRADRQLSRRSRAFWSLVLDTRTADRDNPLWPL